MSNATAAAAADLAPAAAPASASRVQRIARAEHYFAEDLDDQRGWYDRKASANKEWTQRMSLMIILCGALTTFLQMFAVRPWVPIATAVLGMIVTLVQGAQRIWKFDETWQAYRTASERMKRERRLYVNGAGSYGDIADEDGAYRAFVGAVEQIISEEQQLYWQDRSASPASSAPGPAVTETAPAPAAPGPGPAGPGPMPAEAPDRTGASPSPPTSGGS